MAIIRIPPSTKRGLLKALQLDDAAFEAFVSAVNSVPMSLMDRDFPEQLSAKIQEMGVLSLSPTVCADILTTMLSLYRFRSEEECSVDDMAARIIASIEPSADTNSTYNEVIERLKSGLDSKLKGHLLRLLSIRPFENWAKADTLLHEHGHIFHTARILTDIRPVFDETAEELVGAVIVHMLKIRHSENREIKEFYVALDTQDIDDLRNTLDRASKKAERLKAMLSASNTPYYYPEEK
ncbi:MAG: hypothetical protein JNJ94_09890 [Chlorobi bacterium]|jgi:hypothetical protein|nr:hypothetical protein [Chlorobiota bacterium]